jgi:hypothetical protein
MRTTAILAATERTEHAAREFAFGEPADGRDQIQRLRPSATPRPQAPNASGVETAMRSIAFPVALALFAFPALAEDAPADPPPHAKIELSQGVCMHGVFGFHLKTEGATEGNVYIPLDSIAALCRKGQEGEQPQPQEDRQPHEPLPKAQRV